MKNELNYFKNCKTPRDFNIMLIYVGVLEVGGFDAAVCLIKQAQFTHREYRSRAIRELKTKMYEANMLLQD